MPDTNPTNGGDSARADLPLSRLIIEDTFAAVGQDFLRLLVCALAARLGTRYAFITEWSEISAGKPIQLHTRGLWLGSKFGEDFEYSVAGTPCEHVLEGRDAQLFEDSVQQSFPTDSFLVQHAVRSYVATPLFSASGLLLGHLGAMHVDVLQDVESKLNILRAFGARASGELERFQTERELRLRIAELMGVSSRLPDMVCVCAWCKRIRDDQGHWNFFEVYISEHVAAKISHGMCPECQSLLVR